MCRQWCRQLTSEQPTSGVMAMGLWLGKSNDNREIVDDNLRWLVEHHLRGEHHLHQLFSITAVDTTSMSNNDGVNLV